MLNYNFYKSNKEIKLEVKDCLRGSWGQSVNTTFVFSLICLLLIGTTVLLGIFVAWWLSIPIALISMLIMSILSYGYSYFCLKLARQENPTTKDLFCGFSKKIGQVIKLSIKKFFLGIFWLVMLVVPFVVKSIGYSMATFLMIDKREINSDNALKESKHIMTQNYYRYFKLVISFVLWYFLVIVSAGIAFFWVVPRIMTSKALFYENLKTEF